MKRASSIALGIFFIASYLIPARVFAAVQINEVMYDPPGSDTGQEWIELLNTGAAAVDLTRWKFVDGGSATKHGLNVPPKNGGIGSITITPGGYLIIADDAATFEAAYPTVQNVIDSTMSIPDVVGGATATLQLIDDQGAVEDSITYSYDSYASNKGNSLQRTDGGQLISALPTPGAANTSVPYVPPSGTTPNTSTTTPETNSATDVLVGSVPSYVPPPLPQLFADAGEDRTVIVGADTEFDGQAYGRDRNVIESGVRFLWNFGDGSTAEGPKVLHHFEYPGRYATVLYIAEASEAFSDEVIVTAEPAKLAFLALPDGGVAIENRAGRDLDLSGWLVQQFEHYFTLPSHSIILSGATMKISQKTLGFWSQPAAELEYPNGALALHAGENTAPPSEITETKAAPMIVSPSVPAVLPPVPQAAAVATAVKSVSIAASVAAPIASATSAVTASPTSPHTSIFWEELVMGVVGVLALGAAGFWYFRLSIADISAPSKTETIPGADEFEIE